MNPIIIQILFLAIAFGISELLSKRITPYLFKGEKANKKSINFIMFLGTYLVVYVILYLLIARRFGI